METRKSIRRKSTRPVTVADLLAGEGIRDLLEWFRESHLGDATKLVMIWQTRSGERFVKADSSVSDTECLGLLTLAVNMASGDAEEE